MKASRSIVAFVKSQRVARMATASKDCEPYVIPICYGYDGKNFFSVIDEKPKRVSAPQLRRIRNIQSNAKVALVVDEYHEDWRKLRYVLISGRARVLGRGKERTKALRLLRSRYRQYRRMTLDEKPVIKIVPVRVVAWSWKAASLRST